MLQKVRCMNTTANSPNFTCFASEQEEDSPIQVFSGNIAKQDSTLHITMPGLALRCDKQEQDSKRDSMYTCKFAQDYDDPDAVKLSMTQTRDQQVKVRVPADYDNDFILDLAWLTTSKTLPSTENIFSDVDTWKTTWGSDDSSKP